MCAATSLGIMAGAFLNGRLSARGVAPKYPLSIGLVLAVVTATALHHNDAGRLDAACWVISVLGNFAFGLIVPNATEGAMQPLPQIAGAAAAATGFIQMSTASVVSGLVAMFHDEHSALSMTAPMAICSLVALAAYSLLARPVERAVAQT